MRRFILCFAVLATACCIMTSCSKDGDAWKQYSVYITCEEEDVTSPTLFYNQIPLWTVGYGQNNFCRLTPYDDGTFRFIANYELSNRDRPHHHFYITLVLNRATYEKNKKYYINNLIAGSDETEARIEFDYGDYVATSGWIMFSDIKTKSASDAAYYDMEFECEVVDPETGKVRLSAYGLLESLDPDVR